MTYLVTICSFDSTVGANPGWHTALILSKLNTETKNLEVIDSLGFYAVPSTGDPHHWFTRFKKNMGLDLDFFDNHGWLIHEEIRYMDRGHGLHGSTYELNETQFERLQNECNRRLEEQKSAVKEAYPAANFNSDSIPAVRHYQGERYSKEIFVIEKNKAKIEEREPRLRPFDFHLSWAKWRPSLKGSHTCKTAALELLATVLPSEQLIPYTASTFPRFVSGGMENILLHSEGPLDTYTKSSGQKVVYRKKETPEVKLFWSIPPQKLTPLPESGAEIALKVDDHYRNEIQVMVSRLQRVEWVLQNGKIREGHEEQSENYKHILIKKVVACYQSFSFIQPEIKKRTVAGGWSGALFSFFGIPQNSEQIDLQTKIAEAKYLLNSLYLAIVDQWEEETLEHHPETLVTYFEEKDQKAICKILGRSYCKPELAKSVGNEWNEEHASDKSHCH